MEHSQKVAAYCRVSTDKTDQANSFEAQQRFFREHIGRNPQWSLYEIYTDEGITGTSTARREGFNRMIQDGEAGCFSLILTKEISRFSRNILDTVSYTRRLRERGVGVLFLTENVNTLNPEAELLLTFLGTIAQEESRRTSLRVKWGQERQMERGVVFGHSLLGYRVEHGQLTLLPEEAAVVRLVFEKYALEQKSAAAIARELNEAGILPGSGNWQPSRILKLLRNEKYAGNLVQKKTVTTDYLTHRKETNRGQEPLVSLIAHHSPIVTRELWDAAQLQLRQRSRPSGVSVQLPLSGKIRCGVCGSAFVSRRKTERSGNSYRRWSCARKGCTVGTLLRDKDAMDMVAAVWTRVNPLLMPEGERLLNRILTAGESPKANKDAQRFRKKHIDAVEAFLSGHITEPELQALRERYARQEAQWQLAHPESPLPDKGRLRGAIAAILTGREDTGLLCRTLVHSITVFPDKQLQLRLVGLEAPFHFRFTPGIPVDKTEFL